MAMQHFSEHGLLPLCNQLSLRFRNFYYGINPGKWVSKLPHNRIVFILDSGDGNHLIDAGRRIDLRAGSVVMIPAFREVSHDQGADMVHLSLHFNLELFQHLEVLADAPPVFTMSVPELTARIKTVIAASERRLLATMMPALCWEIIFRASASNALPDITRCQIRGSGYAPLFTYLQQHCRAGMDVARMAEIMNLPPDTFCKKFTADIGMPPKSFFNRQLVMQAEKLLLGEDLSIKETAYQLNFSNEFYFSRFFKRHLGISPREYRKKYRNAVADPQIGK